MKKGVDFIGVSVVYFCHDGAGNFVMAQRSQNARDEQGNWDIGGGGVEFDDGVEETLKKEIAEEYGCTVKEFEFLSFRDVSRIQNNTKTHWVALDFKVLVDKNEVKNNEPHKFDAINWFTLDRTHKVSSGTGFRLDNLPKNLHSQLPIFFQKYSDRL